MFPLLFAGLELAKKKLGDYGLRLFYKKSDWGMLTAAAWRWQMSSPRAMQTHFLDMKLFDISGRPSKQR